MNARADIPSALSSTGPQVLPLAATRRRRLAEGTLVPMASGVAGLFFDTPAGTPGDGGRLGASADGLRLEPPFVTTRLALHSGGERHLILTGRGGETLLGRHILIFRGEVPAAQIDPAWLQSPLGDATSLIEGLSDEGRRRLLKLFLTTGPSLFGTRAGTAFGEAARDLLDLLGVPMMPSAAVCSLGAGVVVTYRLPARIEAERIGEIVILDAGRSRRLADCRPVVEPRDGGCLVHVHLPCALPPGATLVGLGPAPIRLRLPGEETRIRSLIPWLARRDAPTRAWVHDLIETTAATDPGAEALMRELRHQDAPPSLAIHHLSATPRGVLCALTLDDPADLVREIRLDRGGAVARLAAGRGGFRGYVVLPRRSAIADRCRLRLILQSGRILAAGERALAPYSGELPPVFGLADAEALAAASLDRERPRGRTRAGTAVGLELFGQPPAAPTLRLIVPADERPDAVQARAAMVLAERGGQRVEILCHGPAPAAEAAAPVLADAAAVFGVAHRLLRLPAAATPLDGLALALELSLELGPETPVLVLGANVLPEGAGWLGAWLRRLGRPWAMLGGTLLDHEGAVCHAGGRLRLDADGLPRRVAPHLGLPAADLPRAPAVMADSLPGADCLGLTPVAAAALAATDPACAGPDVALVLAARRLAREGAATGTFLRGRFTRFGGAAPTPLAAAVEAHVLARLLKPSFNLAPQEE